MLVPIEALGQFRHGLAPLDDRQRHSRLKGDEWFRRGRLLIYGTLLALGAPSCLLAPRTGRIRQSRYSDDRVHLSSTAQVLVSRNN